MRRLAPFAVSVVVVVAWSCGPLPRTVALTNRATVECADPVTMTHSSTVVMAPLDETASFQLDDDEATVTIRTDCTIDGEMGSKTCNLEFESDDGGQTVIVTDGSTTTDVAVACPTRP